MYAEKLDTILDLLVQLKTETNKTAKGKIYSTLVEYVKNSILEYRRTEKFYIFTSDDGMAYDQNNRSVNRPIVLGIEKGPTPLGALEELLKADVLLCTNEQFEEVSAYEILPCLNSMGDVEPVEILDLFSDDDSTEQVESEIQSKGYFSDGQIDFMD